MKLCKSYHKTLIHKFRIYNSILTKLSFTRIYVFPDQISISSNKMTRASYAKVPPYFVFFLCRELVIKLY